MNFISNTNTKCFYCIELIYIILFIILIYKLSMLKIILTKQFITYQLTILAQDIFN